MKQLSQVNSGDIHPKVYNPGRKTKEEKKSEKDEFF
jgi:hypothetical protein